MSDFGIFAKDVTLKVTNEVSRYDRLIKIPCSIGFKQKDKSYVNEWVEVLVFEDLFSYAEGITKGDKIQVSGRVNLTEWTSKSGEKKKTWQIIANALNQFASNGEPVKQTNIKEVPF